MQKKKFFEGKSGITLLALIITIIVMLILAGVSINMVVGENGVLTQAVNATEATDVADNKKKIQTQLVGKYDIDGTYTVQDVLEVAKEVTGNDVDEDAETVLTETGSIVDISDLLRSAKDYGFPVINGISNITINAAQLQLKIDAYDNSGKVYYEFYLNNKIWQSKSSTNSSMWETEYLDQSGFTIKVIAYDDEGNFSELELKLLIFAIVDENGDFNYLLAQSGMNFEEWISSPFNTIGAVIQNDIVCVSFSSNGVIEDDLLNAECATSETIISDNYVGGASSGDIIYGIWFSSCLQNSYGYYELFY